MNWKRLLTQITSGYAANDFEMRLFLSRIEIWRRRCLKIPI
jgi:hypothetical protein